MKMNLSSKAAILFFGLIAGSASTYFWLKQRIQKATPTGPSSALITQKSIQNIGDHDLVLLLDEGGAIWIRTNTKKQMFKYVFDSNGDIEWKHKILLDGQSIPAGSIVYGKSGEQLFKTIFKYRKADGLLVGEDMYDLRSDDGVPQDKRFPIRKIAFISSSNAAQSSPTVVGGHSRKESQIDNFPLPTDPRALLSIRKILAP